MLEPMRWSRTEKSGNLTREVMLALRALSDAGCELSSISFGPHPYQEPCRLDDSESSYKDLTGLMVHLLYYQHTESEDPNIQWDLPRTVPTPYPAEWRKMLQGLKAMQLPLLFNRFLDTEDGGLQTQALLNLLNSLPDTLEELALEAKGPQECYDYHIIRQGSQTLALEPFDLLIRHLRFPKLHSLDLEGWITTMDNLKEFLLAHAPELRTLHLVNMYTCIDEDEHKSVETLPDFISANLYLTGVEISNLRYKAPPRKEEYDDDDYDYFDRLTCADEDTGVRLDASEAYPDERPWLKPWPFADSLDEYSEAEDDYDDEPFQRQAAEEAAAEEKCFDGRRNDVQKRVRPVATRCGDWNMPFGQMEAYW